MQKLSLDALARELVGQAASGEKPGDSRVSRTVVGGHEKALRQTVIALAKDAALAEHASPGEATVLVLRGRVTLAAGAESWEGREGDLIIVPDAPHSLTAQADSAVLLTVVKRPLPRRLAASGPLRNAAVGVKHPLSPECRATRSSDDAVGGYLGSTLIPRATSAITLAATAATYYRCTRERDRSAPAASVTLVTEGHPVPEHDPHYRCRIAFPGARRAADAR